MRLSYFLWGALVIGGGVSLFLLKYKVQALENELVARQEQVIRDRAAIRVLQAEWTYLNDPERLRRLSAEHLGFGPATMQNVIDIDSLPVKKNSDLPAQVSQPTPSAPAVPAVPQIRTQTEATAQHARATGNFVPVLLTRIQRLLFPASAGAATFPQSSSTPQSSALARP